MGYTVTHRWKPLLSFNKVSFLHHRTLLSISMPRYPLMQYMVNFCCIYVVNAFTSSLHSCFLCDVPACCMYSGVFYTILFMVPGIWLCLSNRLVCCRLHLFFYDALRGWLRFSSEAGAAHPAMVSSTTVCSCGVTCDQAPPSGQDGVKLIYL